MWGNMDDHEALHTLNTMNTMNTLNTLSALRALRTNHGDVPLPAFFPDATYGSVKCVDSKDLAGCGVAGVVMNACHLLSKPGLGVLRHFGGARRFSGWDGPILTDSGGFQILSLIRENPKFGEIRKNGIIYRNEDGEKLSLTPEKCIQAQFACGADIMMCLDCCPHPDDPPETTEAAADTTVRWAEKCKAEYEKQLAARKIAHERRPLLFAIIQGGGDFGLRERCARALAGIGFDGYGFGGWPLAPDGRLDEGVLKYTAGLMPDGGVKYAMGVGKPDGVIKCAAMGYNLFDCVIPTRDARRGRLYAFGGGRGLEYDTLYIFDEKYVRDGRPIGGRCGCPACAGGLPRAYIRHLFKCGDPLAYRLATVHNLRFYSDLTEGLRAT